MLVLETWQPFQQESLRPLDNFSKSSTDQMSFLAASQQCYGTNGSPCVECWFRFRFMFSSVHLSRFNILFFCWFSL